MAINLDHVLLPRCSAEWNRKINKAARDALREELELLAEDGMRHMRDSNIYVDAMIEKVWNAIVVASGHDAKKPKAKSHTSIKR